MLDGSLIKGLRDGYLGNITHIVLSDNPPDTNVDYQISSIASTRMCSSKSGRGIEEKWS
jgi:hypothetical protein